MKLTQHQTNIVEYIKNNDDLILVEAVAGSGKTTLLTAIADAIPHSNGIYLAYNKSIATSSKSKFPSTTHCMTTHSMAYQAVVKPQKLTVGVFNYRSITDKISYIEKCIVLDLIKEFCLSKYTSYEKFAEEKEDIETFTPIVLKYLNLMQQGKIDVTHEFYLKLFHILLDKEEITYNDFDFIMLDEAGDLNEVTLEIFKLLPSKKKIAVGDPHQNIYSFNHTINCFEVLEEEGIKFTLPQSFRVPRDIATKVECFCNQYLDADMQFMGVSLKDSTIKTRGFITRTNAALIAKMVELNKQQIPYGLVRSASEIFKLPLLLANMKYQHYVSDPNYKHLQDDYNEWVENDNIKKDFKTPFAYFISLYEDDIQLVQAAKILMQYGKKTVFDTFYEAKKHERKKQNFMLVTAHSSKGLEFDEVIIANDLNDSIANIVNVINTDPDPVILQKDKDALNLYYVACTRALKTINNAVHLRITDECIEKYKENYPEDFL